MSLMERLAACSASDSDSEPMMIMRPDLKTKIVLLGLVFRIITAGKRFLLQRLPSTFSAISFKSRSFSMFIFANDTTFCTNGRFGCSKFFSIPLKKSIKQQPFQPTISIFFKRNYYGFHIKMQTQNDLFLWIGKCSGSCSQSRRQTLLSSISQCPFQCSWKPRAFKKGKILLHMLLLSAFHGQVLYISICCDAWGAIRTLLVHCHLAARNSSISVGLFIYFQQSENRKWTRGKKQAIRDKRAGLLIALYIQLLTIYRFPSLILSRKGPF